MRRVRALGLVAAVLVLLGTACGDDGADVREVDGGSGSGSTGSGSTGSGSTGSGSEESGSE